MEDPISKYWQTRFLKLKKTLETNQFQVFIARDGEEACQLVHNRILPETEPKSISWGGSMTFTAIGLYDQLKDRTGAVVIDAFSQDGSPDDKLERRRRSLLADLYITGTNALTETGKLVNLDMIGNRVAALTFGPHHVVVLVGRNKIVADEIEARARIKGYAAPANVTRLQKKNPCLKTGICEDCQSRERICNTWTVTEKSYPKHRVKIILINQDLGL